MSKPKLTPQFSIYYCNITKHIKHLKVEQRLPLEEHLRNILVAIDKAAQGA